MFEKSPEIITIDSIDKLCDLGNSNIKDHQPTKKNDKIPSKKAKPKIKNEQEELTEIENSELQFSENDLVTSDTENGVYIDPNKIKWL